MNNFAATLLFATGILIGYVNADSCIVCDSENDPNCVQDPSMIMSRNCRTADQAGCYTRIIGTRTLRGCVDEMDESVSKSCRNERYCEICQSLSGNFGCNSNVYPVHRLSCHQCSGNLISNCSIENLNPKACRTYTDFERCYIRKTKTDIERGCLSETNKCSNAYECFICDGHGCNFLNSNNTDIPVADSSAALVPSILILMLASIVTKLC